jgi:ferredoxin
MMAGIRAGKLIWWKLNVFIGVPFERACGGNADCTTCHVYIDENLMLSPNYDEPT